MEKYKFFEENINLAYYTLHKYLPKYINDEDVKQVALIGLWRACLVYDPNRGVKFSVFAIRCILNECYYYFRSENKIAKLHLLSLDKLLDDNDTNNSGTYIDTVVDETLPDPDESLLADEFLNSLTDRERYIVCSMRDGMTQHDACKPLGISQSYLSRLLRKIKAKYREYIKGEDYVKHH